MKFSCLQIAKAADLHPGRQSGNEQLFRCPRHDDQRPSLSINLVKNLFLCGPCNAGGNAWQLASFLARIDPSDKPGVWRWLHEHGLGDQNQGNHAERRSSPPDSIVATYPYTDENGEFLFETVRLAPKSFRVRRKDSNNEWAGNIESTRRVLYRLPEVQAADAIFIVEGEKDADRLHSLGLTATCNPFGAGKWIPEYSNSFKQHQRVVVIPDNDESGRKHSREIAQSLKGRVISIKILELSGLPHKGDISDWLNEGGTPERLCEIVRATPEYSHPRVNDPNVMHFTSVGDLLNEPEDETPWLVEDHLPAGGDSLLIAKPKVGKSTLARCLAFAVARGDEFLGCQTTRGTVLYLALEEKRSEVQRHFRAMGSRPDDSIYIFCAPSPEDGLEQLRTAAESLKPALILVDPLLRFSRIKDSNDYSQVTKALEPLHALARETGAHVLAVHHEAKRGGSGGDGVLGSTAIFASVDTLLIMKRNERYRTLSSIQRYGIDLEEITLQYDSETRTLSAGVSRSDADEADVAKDILEFLTTQTEPVDESAIQQAIVAQRAKQLKALRRLLDEGKLIRTGEGKKGDKYLYQIAGTQVPPIYPVPEKLDPKNPITASLVTTNAGTEPLLEFQSVDETPDPALTSTQERL